MVMRVVSNTSPLSNLAAIDKIDLLQQIYPQILIPPTVHTELIRFPKIQPEIDTCLKSGFLDIRQPTNTKLIQTLNQPLDLGEAEAIALAVEIKADRLLIDESLGRGIAEAYTLKIRGILGILVNAKEQGLLTAVKPLLDDLIETAGFRVSNGLYERILQAAGEW
jgi:predicted nucleic acid-binding protein